MNFVQRLVTLMFAMVASSVRRPFTNVLVSSATPTLPPNV